MDATEPDPRPATLDSLERPPSAASSPAAADAPASAEALAAAAEHYRPRLLAAAARILRDPAEAEDAVQDALVSALRSLHRFRGEAQLSSWLFRITVNCALMRLRSRRRRPTLSLEELPGRAADRIDAATPAPDQQLIQRERLARLGRSLAGLPEVQREALWLRGVRGCPVSEVAAAVGRTPTAAKMLVHRARERLREELGPAEAPRGTRRPPARNRAPGLAS